MLGAHRAPLQKKPVHRERLNIEDLYKLLGWKRDCLFVPFAR